MKSTFEQLVELRVDVACIAQAVAKIAREIDSFNLCNLEETVEDMNKIIRKTYRNDIGEIK